MSPSHQNIKLRLSSEISKTLLKINLNNFMIHHPGKVVAVIKPSDDDVSSADNITLAVVKMWDENVLTLVVDERIAENIREGDFVLVDYRPKVLGQNTVVPRQRIVKIVRGERARKIWEIYREYFKQQKTKATQHMRPYIG